MHSRWTVPGLPSGLKPASPAFGDEPPDPHPPDSPDPNSPFALNQFPSFLDTSPTISRSRSTSKPNYSAPKQIAEATLVHAVAPSCGASGFTGSSVDTTVPALGSKETVASEATLPTISATSNGAESSLISVAECPATGKALDSQNPPFPSPIASLPDQACTNQNPIHNPPQHSIHKPTPQSKKGSFSLTSSKTLDQDPQANFSLAPPVSLPSQTAAPQVAPVFNPSPTLAEQIREREDKTLSRLAHVSISATGRPRVLIPDSVFQKGAEMHKDFIICYFNGKPPPFHQIQSVFNHMWGKGKHLEIHNNPLKRSTMVRIQSEYLRQKILDKCIWYVGESMFHTAQWSSAHSSSTPPLKAIKIWAHLTGVPLDLRHKQGLSLVAGLIGDPKKTDEFTLNMVSLTFSHVKVEVDLTRPLPRVVEFERESGEVVEVQADYPWTPSTCSHCHELGHIIKNCLTYSPPTDPKDAPAAQGKQPINNTPKKSVRPQGQNSKSGQKSIYVPIGSQSTSSSTLPQKKTRPPPNKKALPEPRLDLAPPPLLNSFSSPVRGVRPSLKRARSSPSLSPPAPTKDPDPPNETSKLTLPSISNSSCFTLGPFPPATLPNFTLSSNPFQPLDATMFDNSGTPIMGEPILPSQ
ncbi:DUF4283 domain-containing protein [Raphanus sativus]|nr:DUF4283 domain-containing protein [Raphanus sativus]